jgi:hypothetical protein
VYEFHFLIFLVTFLLFAFLLLVQIRILDVLQAHILVVLPGHVLATLLNHILIAPSLRSCYSKLTFLLHFSVVFLLLQVHIQVLFFLITFFYPKLAFLLFMSSILLVTHQHTMNSILLVIHQYTIILEPFHVAFGFLIFLLWVLTLWLHVFQDGCSSCGLLMLLLFKVIHYFLPF